MNFQEWTILVKGLKSVYTSQNFLPDEYAVKIWFKLLEDIPYKTLNDGIMRWCVTEHFPPTVADLRSAVAENIAPVKDWSEAWREVQDAVKRFGMYQQDAGLDSLSDASREAAVRIGWINLCMQDIDDEMANRAQFRDVFNSISGRRRTETVIPAKLLERIGKAELPG